VVAPGGPVRRPGIDRGIAWLRERGFEVVVGATVTAPRTGYLAADDVDRARDLRRLLADPGIAAIWFARGGYGSARIVESIDFRPLRRRPKALIGYSDITVLQIAAWRQAGLVTYQGPLAGELGDPAAFDEAALWRALGPDGIGPIEFRFERATVARPGRAEGILLGGCLSLIASLTGTPHALRADGAILFWEDVNEEPYRIDRMLNQVRQAGLLGAIRGMVVGRLPGCAAADPDNGLPIREILDRHLGTRRIPVIDDFPAGHCPGKVTLPLGRRARLDTRAGRLTLGD
jgi:muramoyltetrapeptide carboxypeptidase